MAGQEGSERVATLVDDPVVCVKDKPATLAHAVTVITSQYELRTSRGPVFAAWTVSSAWRWPQSSGFSQQAILQVAEF